MEIVFATKNEGKAREARRIGQSLGCRILDLRDISGNAALRDQPDVLETELSYEGNAKKKALTYARRLGRPCLSDDTGLEIEALGGLPGLYTARFGIRRVSTLLIPERRYHATFVCCVSYAEPSGRSVSVTSKLVGFIRFPQHALDDGSGVPFSAYFLPQDEIETLHDLSARGNYLTHRGRAIRVLIKSLFE